MNERTSNEKPATAGSAKIVYILYLVSIVIGISAIVVVIMCFV